MRREHLNLTESLRNRLIAVMGNCPICKCRTVSERFVARSIGMSASTVCRFLQGKGVSSVFLDKLEKWLFEVEKKGSKV